MLKEIEKEHQMAASIYENNLRQSLEKKRALEEVELMMVSKLRET